MSVHLSVVPDPQEGEPLKPDHAWDGGHGDLTSDDAWAAPRPDGEDSSTHALFPGDRGELTMPARRALLALTKLRFISTETHPAESQALLDHIDAIESRPNDLFLLLVVDREREAAGE